MTEERPSYSALLRNRSFASLWAAQVISQSGDAVFDVALMWLVLVTTGSTALVGLTQAAVLVPSVLCAPVAGVYADRLNRRNLMIVSNLVQGVVTAAIALLYVTASLSYSILIVFVLLLYTGNQFFRAANSAIIPRIASREDLPAANSLFMLSTSANQLASYATGGVIIVVLGTAFPITYDSVTFFLAAALLTFVAKSYGQVKGGSTSGDIAGEKSFGQDFREGLAYVTGAKIFRQLLMMGLLVNFLGAGVIALLAPYTKFWIHGNASIYGFTLASYALGNIVGSIFLGKVNYRDYVGRLLFIGVIGFGILLVGAGLVTSVPLALVIFCLLGLAQAVVNQPIQVLVQTQVPGELLGRTVTVMGAVLTASQPIAAVLSGWLAGATSIGTVYLGFGAAMALVAVAFYLPFSDLRQARY
ncbi:MAG: MFS transporter [Conexivisphaerales archaeon]|jgi:MFS family permease